MVKNTSCGPASACLLWRVILRLNHDLPSLSGLKSPISLSLVFRYDLTRFLLISAASNSKLSCLFFFQVLYLKIIEKSGYTALPWVRYITQNGDYQLRMVWIKWTDFKMILAVSSAFVAKLHSNCVPSLLLYFTHELLLSLSYLFIFISIELPLLIFEWYFLIWHVFLLACALEMLRVLPVLSGWARHVQGGV